jgi:hypothetical protein
VPCTQNCTKYRTPGTHLFGVCNEEHTELQQVPHARHAPLRRGQ